MIEPVGPRLLTAHRELCAAVRNADAALAGLYRARTERVGADVRGAASRYRHALGEIEAELRAVESLMVAESLVARPPSAPASLDA